MPPRSVVNIFAIAMLGLAMVPEQSMAQQGAFKEQLNGARTLVSIYLQYEDGSKIDPYGADAKGSLIINQNGRYSLAIIGAVRPKFAANNRYQGTSEENAAVVRATEIFFGTYSVDETEKTITFHLERAIFPNWDGTDRKFTVAFHGDEMETVGPPTPGPKGIFRPHIVWR